MTNYRRRQYRDRHCRQASEVIEMLKGCAYLAVAMLSFGLLILTVVLGQSFVDVLLGN